jgi:hypothetical protein
MKTLKNLLGLFMMLLMLIAYTSCEKSEVMPTPLADQTEIVQVDVTATNLKSLNLNYVPTAPLTQDETAGLLFMREEEKLAHDVYIYFFNLYGENIFNRIANSEQRHTDAILGLINFYGLTDPALATPGSFTNADLQTLYTTLINQGSTSIADALAVGALIEELDILDLDAELLNTSNENLIKVYGNLLKGSHNHLRAFVKALDFNGVTYVPQLLDPAAYELIITSSNNGNGGNGTGTCNGTCTGTCNGTGTGTCTGTGNPNGGPGNGNGTGNPNGGQGNGTGTCNGTGNGTAVCDSTGVGSGPYNGSNGQSGGNGGSNGGNSNNPGNSGGNGNNSGNGNNGGNNGGNGGNGGGNGGS